jgi:hypothetical protein
VDKKVIHRLFADFGEYIPGFFKISINKELYEGIGWNDFSKEEKATLVHEYVHFLQDISTTRGVSNFVYLAKQLQLYLAKSAECKDKIYLPINLEYSNVENAYTQSELMSFYAGNNSHKKIHHVDRVERIRDEIINDLELNLEAELFSINIYYDNKDIAYVFGTDCIAESMAYLVESNSFDGYKRENEFPYNACELVCRQICPEILKKKEILVAICELALMHYHSGDMFWNIINHIKENQLDFQNVNDLENYFKNKTEFLVENLAKNKMESMDAIDFLYPKKLPNMGDVNAEVKKYIADGYDLRESNAFFIARILEAKNTDEYFLKLMNKFGIPILCDKKHQIFSGKELSMMIVPIAVLNIFTCMADSKCLIYEFCCEGRISQIDENCLQKPWKKSGENNLCPFAAYWYFYSLDGKEISKN